MLSAHYLFIYLFFWLIFWGLIQTKPDVAVKVLLKQQKEGRRLARLVAWPMCRGSAADPGSTPGHITPSFLYHLCQRGNVSCRFTQKLPNRSSWNLDGGWVSTSLTLGTDPDKRIGILSYLFNIMTQVFFDISINFSMINASERQSGVFRWLVSMRHYNFPPRSL